ncbi:hypothetical protein ACWCSD_03640 [Nonomuraea sp. NPDC001684]
MGITRRTLAAGFAALAIAGGITVGASPANAATDSCVSFSEGTLCASIVWSGWSPNYRAQLYRTAPGSGRYDFHLYCSAGRWFGDEGAFTAAVNEVKSYVFQVGNQGSCRVELRNGNDGSLITATGYIQP